MARKLGIDEPQLPRKRKTPQRFESGAGHFLITVEDNHKAQQVQVPVIRLNKTSLRPWTL